MNKTLTNLSFGNLNLTNKVVDIKNQEFYNCIFENSELREFFVYRFVERLLGYIIFAFVFFLIYKTISSYFEKKNNIVYPKIVYVFQSLSLLLFKGAFFFAMVLSAMELTNIIHIIGYSIFYLIVVIWFFFVAIDTSYHILPK